jgi:hypothetical protein
MKFSEWMKIKEDLNNPLQSLIGGLQGGAVKPTIKKKDTTVDNVRSILMKSKDPKMAIKQVGQVYDNQMKSSTDPAEIAVASRTKSKILGALSK